MLKAMLNNGSSPDVFETDEGRMFFLVRLPFHPRFVKEAEERKRQTTGQVTGQVAVQVLQFCEQPRKAGEMQDLLGVKHRQTFRENYLNVFLSNGWLARTIPPADREVCRLHPFHCNPPVHTALIRDRRTRRMKAITFETARKAAVPDRRHDALLRLHQQIDQALAEANAQSEPEARQPAETAARKVAETGETSRVRFAYD